MASAAMNRRAILVRFLRDAVCGGVWPVPACYTIRSIDLAGNIATRCLISGRYFCVLLLRRVLRRDGDGHSKLKGKWCTFRHSARTGRFTAGV